jgi:hypothetical protein
VNEEVTLELEELCMLDCCYGAVAQPKHFQCRWGPRVTWDWRGRTVLR